MFLYQYATTPVGISKKRAVVWIKPGQSFSETAAQLEKVGLVRYPKRFRWLAYLKGDETRIRAGEYLLCASMTPSAILDTIVRGETLLHKVVIPEGATIFNIGEILEKAGLVSARAFLQAASDPDLVEALGIEGHTLEGYLFPETYHFPKGVTAEDIAKKMVVHFRSVFTPDWAKRARAMGFTTPVSYTHLRAHET